MTAPSPYDINSTVVIGPWRRWKHDQRAAIAAQIETLERRQVARYAELDKLSELIGRRQHEIDVLRGQLQ